MVCAACGSSNPPASRFCGHCGAALLPAADTQAGDNVSAPLRLPSHLAKRLLESRFAIEGERKQITVLFADIKGSTNLIQDLDPEQADRQLRPVLDIMMEAVHRYEGTVNRVEGDGIMALFGAPIAHEDSAVRAAFAALDMQTAVHALDGSSLSIRVGLHAGEALVRAINTDFSVEYDAIGATVHLAARMEQMAEPGKILGTAHVARLTQGFIRAKSLGPHEVKGFREPLETFEIVGHTAARTRWEATASGRLTQFINRSSELDELRRAMHAAESGAGRLGGIVGDPGTGKSRLVHELVHALKATDWIVLKTTTAPYTRNTPYLAFSKLIRIWCEIPDHASFSDIDHRLTARLTALGVDPSFALPAIHSVLDMPETAAEWRAVEPDARRQRILQVAKALILRSAALQPLLLWFEDMQWADAETRDLLEAVADEIERHRLLILLTYRPEYQHRWSGKSYFTSLQIQPLANPEAERLARTLLGRDKDELCRLLVQRTDGVPLFIEETVRSLAEDGVIRGVSGTYELSREVHSIKIPDSVQAVLASRIDRLPLAQKELLQTASVIGVEVQMSLLEEVAQVRRADLIALIADLQAADFLYEVPNSASYEYKFRHMLAHEVAYNSLLSTRRQMLHARTVRAIESRFAANIAEVVERLAYHALHAQMWPEALAYSRQAGDQAVELSAYREARVFFEQAIEILAHLPRDRANAEMGIDIYLSLRAIFGATADYQAVESCLKEAEALAVSIGDRSRLAAIFTAQTLLHNWRGDLDASIACGVRALEIAGEIGDDRLKLSASFYLGQAYMWWGDFQRSLVLLEENRSWTKGALGRERIGTTGTSSVLWLGMLAASHAYLGHFGEASEVALEACAIAEEVQRPYDMALAYWYAGFVLSHRGDIASAIERLERGYEVASAAQIRLLVPVLSTSLGSAYAAAGRIEEGIRLLNDALGFSRAANFNYGLAWSTVYLGFAKLAAGRAEGVIAQAREAVGLTSRHHYKAVEASAHRLLAAASQFEGDAATAEREYLASLAISLELGLRPEAAHCQHGLSQVYARLGRTAESARLRDAAETLYAELGMQAASAG